MKRHSDAEIESKLREARQLLASGQTQAQACKELGVSVMTYHRWRRLEFARHDHDLTRAGRDLLTGGAVGQRDIASKYQIDNMRIENERLRRIAADLLLEKVKVEERLATIFRGRRF